MNRRELYATLAMGALCVSGCVHTDGAAPYERYSLIRAIKNGYLHGVVDVETVRKRSSFGIGGFDSLSGEMLLLDGVAYRIPLSGVPEIAKDSDTLTDAEVTHFRPTIRLSESAIGKAKLLQKLTEALRHPNQFYSFKITGTFSKFTYRTVVEQPTPYKKPVCAKLIDKVFKKENVQGTIVGFLNPSFVSGGIDYPGSHMHFLSADRTFAGHVYDFDIASATVEIGAHQVFVLHLPTEQSFAELDLNDNYPCPEQN